MKPHMKLLKEFNNWDVLTYTKGFDIGMNVWIQGVWYSTVAHKEAYSGQCHNERWSGVNDVLYVCMNKPFQARVRFSHIKEAVYFEIDASTLAKIEAEEALEKKREAKKERDLSILYNINTAKIAF